MKDEEKSRQQLIGELADARRKVARLEKMVDGRIPPGKPEKGACGPLPSGGTGADGTMAEAKGGTVLVVDDDRQFRGFVARTLDRFGYKAVEAEGIEAALAVIGKSPVAIGLILADIMLPGSSGHELVRKVRQVQPDIKVLYMSGYAEGAVVPDDVFNVMERGGRLLQKPFTPDELLAEVRRKLTEK